MMENYVYPDTHEMFDLHDTLEELISKESYDIGLGLGSRVDSDPDLEYLLEVLFTPAEARCSYLDIWGSKKYPDIITDIKDGKFMDMSMEEFEEKRKKYDFAQPFTKESLLYREIFEKYYPGQAPMVKDFWMPNKSWKGCDVNDPSARVLSNYGESGT